MMAFVPRRAIPLVIALAASAPAPLRAQSAQTTGGDLTLPPAWRGAAEVSPATPIATRQSKARHVAADARPPAGAKPHPKPTPEHSVDLGVVVRGGSGTPRVYGAAGTSEAIQESGSTFGAGMRFGF